MMVRSRFGAVSCALVLVLAAAARAESAHVRESARLALLEDSAADFRAGLRAYRNGDLESARGFLRAAIARDENFVEAMVDLARICIDTGELERAERWLDRAADRRTDYPDLHAVRGLLELRRGNAAAAVRHLSDARRLDPRDSEVLTNLGAALLEQGFVADAIEPLTLAVRLAPRLHDAILDLALAYDRAGDVERAVFHYRRFLEVSRSGDAVREDVVQRVAELRGEPLPSPPNPRGDSRSIAGAAAPAGGPEQ